MGKDLRYISILSLGFVGLTAIATFAAEPASRPAAWPAGVPTVHEMITAKTDVWGDAAMRQPDGASYEFFVNLLPPLRYVNTEFKHYPIVLAAPRSQHKPRLTSDGSAVNARAKSTPMWKDAGAPVAFCVGQQREPFGQDAARREEPRFEQGYLPIVRIAYRDPAGQWIQESLASVSGELAERSAVLVRFERQGSAGEVAARIDAEDVRASPGALRDKQGRLLLLFESVWRWDSAKRELVARLEPSQTAALAIMTALKPEPLATGDLMPRFAGQRRACMQRWQQLLADAEMQLDVPEPLVNDAWRALVIANLMIARGDWMCYSAGNNYDHLYAGESGDALRGLLLFGFLPDARDFMGPLMEFERKDVRFQSEGLKLQHLAAYYWLTRDADFVRQQRPRWTKAVELFFSSREKDSGLMPRQNYCGDIPQQVYPLTANANAWRGLRDHAVVLAEIGEAEHAGRIAAFAKDYRESIIKAVEKSELRDTQPPFIPNALFGEQKPDSPITATTFGSYYCLVAPYIIGSGVLGVGSQREDWLLGYLQQHGGVKMGLISVMPHKGVSAEQPGINPLYGLRYTLTLLRRDEREKALVSFYAMLAHGLTRNTFIGGEGNRFLQGDELGRFFYLPPNTTGNSYFLHMLRYLLIQDWDLDDDGRPETLRLLYGAPQRWLAEGKTIRIARAPTAFGTLSMVVQSALSRGEVTVRVTAPPIAPKKILLRLPLPTGWKVTAARLGSAALPLGADGAVDLTGKKGELVISFQVAR